MYNQFMVMIEGTTLDPLTDWILMLLKHQSVIAPIFLLTLEEAGIPLPVPGDLVIAYTGYEISQNRIAYFSAFILLLIAILIGSSILYALSLRYGDKLVRKVGKYIHLDDDKLTKVEEYFNKYGALVIIFGRHIPGFRIPITVFAGMSKVTYKKFLSSTFISVIFWIIIYLQIGKNLGPKTISLFSTYS